MPAKRPLRLSLKLDGPLVADHRLPLTEFERITRQLRVGIRDVAVVLARYGPSGRGGRVPKFIEEATDLRLVAQPRAGSFELELEVPPEPTDAQLELPADVGAALAERAVEAFVAGLEILEDDTEELPNGFDRGVLRAVAPFRSSLRRGVSKIALSTTNGKEHRIRTSINAEKLAVVERLITKPIRAQTTAEGTLQMVLPAGRSWKNGEKAHREASRPPWSSKEAGRGRVTDPVAVRDFRLHPWARLAVRRRPKLPLGAMRNSRLAGCLGSDRLERLL
jgi:hypothetical protein